jgi:hypothetical protein
VTALAGLLPLVSLVLGCGRLSFDAPGRVADAGADAAVAFGASCAVGLAMDEAVWTGAAGEVLDSCGGGRGTAVQGAQDVDDTARGRTGEFPVPSGCLKIADAPALHATIALTLSAWVYPLALDGVNP